MAFGTMDTDATTPPVAAAPPPARPVLLYDRDCAVCRCWARRWRQATHGSVDFAPFQSAGQRFPQVTPERAAAAVQLVRPNGTVVSGAAAVFEALETRGVFRLLRWMHAHIRPFRSAAEWAYTRIAANRESLSRASRILSRARAQTRAFWRRAKPRVFTASSGSGDGVPR